MYRNYIIGMDKLRSVIESNRTVGGVPYEIFKQAMDWNTENMREIYSILHELTMTKLFQLEYKVGDIVLSVQCDKGDIDAAVEAVERMSSKMSKKIFDKERLSMLVKAGTDKVTGKKDDTNTIYN